MLYHNSSDKEQCEQFIVIDSNAVNSHAAVMIVLCAAPFTGAAVVHPRYLPHGKVF